MRKILKPWGYEQILEKNKKYVVKKLFMKKNHRCSLQYHKVKLETVYVLSGILKFQVGSKINNLKTKILRPGDCVSINKKKNTQNACIKKYILFRGFYTRFGWCYQNKRRL